MRLTLVEFYISAAGTADEVTIVESDFDAGNMLAVITETITSVDFGEAYEGCYIRYPIIFTVGEPSSEGSDSGEISEATSPEGGNK